MQNKLLFKQKIYRSMSINLYDKLSFNYSKRVSSFFYNNISRIKGLFRATKQ